MPADQGAPIERLRVRIAVLTYQRPGDIADALPLLLAQAKVITGAAIGTDIVVVDNDPTGSARGLVEEFAASCPGVVTYEHEVEPGISAARNRALDTAGDYDVLVFIDDDERPTERWLAWLLETYLTYHSAAVVGPVVSSFELSPDSWVVAGGFFDRRRHRTGTEVRVAATNNLLLDLHQVRRLGVRFDAAFGTSGGGDTLFTRSLHRLGATLVWCDEAVVLDVVPAARTTRSWVLRRALRSGNSDSSTALRLADTRRERARVRAVLTARGAVRVAIGGARCAVGTVAGSPRHQARGLRTAIRGAGLLAGAWGFVYGEYRRSPVS